MLVGFSINTPCWWCQAHLVLCCLMQKWAYLSCLLMLDLGLRNPGSVAPSSVAQEGTRCPSDVLLFQSWGPKLIHLFLTVFSGFLLSFVHVQGLYVDLVKEKQGVYLYDQDTQDNCWLPSISAAQPVPVSPTSHLRDDQPSPLTVAPNQ